MNLFILRHASAGVRRSNPLLDVKRPLDKDGKRHCLHLALVLNAMKISFDLVISSPLKRSQQTAQLVATETGYEQKILISNALLPAATFAQFQRLLRECDAYENVLVVGHNPNITAFLSQLVGGQPATTVPAAKAAQPASAPAPPKAAPAAAAAAIDDRLSAPARIRLRKGSLARLSLQSGPAVLQSLLEPRTVRALYATSTKSSRRNTSRK
jgi:phosphohistidine phosphatase